MGLLTDQENNKKAKSSGYFHWASYFCRRISITLGDLAYMEWEFLINFELEEKWETDIRNEVMKAISQHLTKVVLT